MSDLPVYHDSSILVSSAPFEYKFPEVTHFAYAIALDVVAIRFVISA